MVVVSIGAVFDRATTLGGLGYGRGRRRFDWSL